MHRDCYSPILERRYRATIAHNGTVLAKRWPCGCFGAANAFLVLVGPSMGGVLSNETPKRGGANRPHYGKMAIGRDLQSFDWHDHRKARWSRLCAEILGAESYVSSMTSLMNLDWMNSTDESAIPQEDLNKGLRGYVWPLLCLVRPRIICTLSNRVWDTMLSAIQDCEPSNFKLRFSLADSKGNSPSRTPLVFRLPNSNFSTLLVKPHRHPSRALSYEQCSIIGRACHVFLNQPA